MPMRGRGPCRVRACPYQRMPNSSYCETHGLHGKQEWYTSGRHWYYTARWRALRQHVLEDSPLCVECLRVQRITVAKDIDHITPHHGDAALFWNRDNLQALCIACHARKTRYTEAPR